MGVARNLDALLQHLLLVGRLDLATALDQGQGVGRSLLELVERAIAARGGGNLYIETSSKTDYARSRRFYKEAGYRRVAQLRDFYAPGDHKLMFCKTIRARR